MLNSKKRSFIVCGQVLTGRLEVLESFFRKRFPDVAVIGISSVSAKKNAARCTVYKNYRKYSEKKLLNLIFGQKSRIKGILFPLAYMMYFISALFSLLLFFKYRKRSVFVGIGTFPAFLGIIFKKLGFLDRVIYYSIDYFPLENKSFLVKGVFLLDNFCVKNSDLVWSISPRIIESRANFARVAANTYDYLPVPLCFDESLLRFRPEEEVERWTIVFVGTPGYFHGLGLIIEAMPKIIKLFPQIKIKIIGPGPWDEIKNNIEKLGLTGYFDFVGFIDREEDLFEAVSKNALGLALYVPVAENPTFYADPGKPKLYTFCSVPVVITKTPAIAREIDASGAGKAIDFNVDSLVDSLIQILSDDKQWSQFRKAAYEFASGCTSKEILEPVIKKSIIMLN